MSLYCSGIEVLPNTTNMIRDIYYIYHLKYGWNIRYSFANITGEAVVDLVD